MTKTERERVQDAIKRSKCAKEVTFDEGKMVCLTCAVKIPFDKKNISSRLTQHLKTNMHKKSKFSAPNQTITSVLAKRGEKEIERESFRSDLLNAFMSADVPLYKLRNAQLKRFLQKWTNQQIPCESYFRKFTESMADNVLAKIREKIGTTNAYFIVDETSDSQSRNVVNILVGKLSREPSRAMLLDVQFQNQTNNVTIQEAILKACTLLWPGKATFPKLHLIVSDQAEYMLKAVHQMKLSKQFYPNVHHITCINHALNLVCNAIRKNELLVDKLFAKEKEFFCNSNKRKRVFRSKTKLSLIPHPILTRWGSWIKTVEFHLKENNFDTIRSFFLDWNSGSSETIECIRKVFKGNLILVRLQDLQKYIRLPGIIKELENRSLSLKEQFKLLDEAKNLIKGTKYEEILNASLLKNPDLIPFTETNSLGERLDRQYAPLTSCEVERSFSIYNSLLRENRRSFKPRNIRSHMLVRYNSFLS